MLHLPATGRSVPASRKIGLGGSRAFRRGARPPVRAKLRTGRILSTRARLPGHRTAARPRGGGTNTILLPVRETERLTWLQNFALKLNVCVGQAGIVAGDLTAVNGYRDHFLNHQSDGPDPHALAGFDRVEAAVERGAHREPDRAAAAGRSDLRGGGAAEQRGAAELGEVELGRGFDGGSAGLGNGVDAAGDGSVLSLFGRAGAAGRGPAGGASVPDAVPGRRRPGGQLVACGERDDCAVGWGLRACRSPGRRGRERWVCPRTPRQPDLYKDWSHCHGSHSIRSPSFCLS